MFCHIKTASLSACGNDIFPCSFKPSLISLAVVYKFHFTRLLSLLLHLFQNILPFECCCLNKLIQIFFTFTHFLLALLFISFYCHLRSAQSPSGLYFHLNYWLLIATFREGNGTLLQYSCLENPMDGGAWQAAVHGVTKSQTRLSNFTFTFHFHALEKEMATHSSVLAWRIPGMGEPGGLPSMGSHRVGHD